MGRSRVNICTGIVLAFAPLAGCARLELAMHQPKPRPGLSSSSAARVMLASFQEPPERPRQDDSRQLVGPPAPEGTGDEREPASSGTRTYTAPGAAYQQLGVAVAAVALTIVGDETDELGREISESLAVSDGGTVGRLGLVATPTRLAGRVTSRPGLQDGPATGLGFASTDRNLFRPQLNPASGAGGRCQDLARSGFFGGSRSACEQSFRRR